jgi:hypothetical protein
MSDAAQLAKNNNYHGPQKRAIQAKPLNRL